MYSLRKITLFLLLAASLEGNNFWEKWTNQSCPLKVAAVLGGEALFGLIAYKYYSTEPMVNLDSITIQAGSWNVLAEKFYKNHAENAGKAWNQRKKLFTDFVKFLQDKDFICFQEFDTNRPLYNQLKKNYTFIFSDSAQKQIGTAIAYNNKKWDARQVDVRVLEKKKNIVARLRHFSTRAEVVVASAHMPSVKKDDVVLQGEYLNTLTTMCNQLKSSATLASIIMGDFNYNTYDAQVKNYPPRKKFQKLSGLKTTMKTNDYDMLSESIPLTPSAYGNGFTRMDYAFTSIFPPFRLTQTSLSFMPSDLNELLTHTAEDNNKNFPSDHALMQVSLTIEK